MAKSAGKPASLESVARVAALLRALAAGQGRGIRLSDLSGTVGLSHSTTHRLLTALTVERLVKRHAETRLYQLGEDLSLLGWSAAVQSVDIRELGGNAVKRIAEVTGDTAYLAVRFGFESVCVDRQFGAHPIKVLTIDVGSRRPLGVGAGALALLAALPDHDIAQVLPAIVGRLAAFPAYRPEILPRLVAQTRARGYSLSDGQIAEGVRGIGVAVLGQDGMPIGALSVAAISSRITGAALEKAVAVLMAEKLALEKAVRSDAAAQGGWLRAGRHWRAETSQHKRQRQWTT